MRDTEQEKVLRFFGLQSRYRLGCQVLKILVSVVRFRPRPPNPEKPIVRGGLFNVQIAGIAQLVERYLAKV